MNGKVVQPFSTNYGDGLKFEKGDLLPEKKERGYVKGVRRQTKG